ncbi:unnamed protein product [Lota lota]
MGRYVLVVLVAKRGDKHNTCLEVVSPYARGHPIIQPPQLRRATATEARPWRPLIWGCCRERRAGLWDAGDDVRGDEDDGVRPEGRKSGRGQRAGTQHVWSGVHHATWGGVATETPCCAPHAAFSGLRTAVRLQRGTREALGSRQEREWTPRGSGESPRSGARAGLCSAAAQSFRTLPAAVAPTPATTGSCQKAP